ncbi:efflux transporter outer membrane subunit [Pusillimonas sp. NJUB218]|uniref:efflux transporter outer membrane subunit n=1 Tax=Pusillimonas sp. NJUB218 TaxID=2023230 RepID=UPI000F4D0242|nr:efflux transporter outer membrane subunit [Pusillimonas sp. NJUB218]ROT45211.1 multidrug transporter [Pusillimonas sp. NJUB218]
MTRSTLKFVLAPVLASLVLAGCSLAPKYERPVAPVPGMFPNAPTSPAAMPVSASADLGWREFFRDPQLQSLIQVALENNRDLRIAIDRVEEARALFGIQQSERLPTIGVGGNASIQSMPDDLRAGGASAPSVTRVYQAGVGITSFELDFFGRVRNLSEAAYQQFLASEQARRTVHITLVSQVAESYFRLRAIEQQRALVERTLKARQASYDLIKQRYDVGVAGSLDLYQAKSQLDSVRADLQEIRRAEQLAQNALLLVLGTTPSNLPQATAFSQDQLLAQIPVGLPSDLLTRRPDIIAAENGLLAANANIGAARAAFFPNISLTGMLGFASGAMGGLFSGANRFWSFTPQLTMPLFSGGVRGNLDLAEARKNIAVSQYEKSIQTAFREVADALAGEATYAEQLNALRDLETSAAESLKIAQLRYDNGIDSFLQVQAAEITLYNAQRSFLDTGLNSLMNRVELYKALGGGWLENSAAPSAAAPEASKDAS